MKRARIIHGIVWACITLAVVATVVAEWHAQGCSVKSLVLATILYTAMGVGLWGCGDKCMTSPTPPEEGLNRRGS